MFHYCYIMDTFIGSKDQEWTSPSNQVTFLAWAGCVAAGHGEGSSQAVPVRHSGTPTLAVSSRGVGFADHTSCPYMGEVRVVTPPA